MTTVIEYKLESTGETVTVRVTTLNEFEKCIEDKPSPFKHGASFLDPKIDLTKHQIVFVKCLIEEDQRAKVAKQTALSGEAICHEVVEKFLGKRFRGKKIKSIETINCSHYEQQYKYVVIESYFS